MRIIPLAAAGVIAVLGLTVMGGSWYTVDQGERAVLLRNGALVGTAGPGLGFKLPIIDSAIEISVQEHSLSYGADMSKFQVYTRDKQVADIRFSVNYAIPVDGVDEVYVQYGGAENLVSRIVDPKVKKIVQAVFGTYTADFAIQNQLELTNAIQKELASVFEGEPVTITSVQIENIDFDDVYEQVARDRAKAEVEVLKQKQVLEQEKVNAQIAVTQAQAIADSNLAKAKSLADATRLAGDAEAAAIRAKGAALRDNPALVDLTKAERWDGKLPTTMVPGGTVPFMPVGGTQ